MGLLLPALPALRRLILNVAVAAHEVSPLLSITFGACVSPGREL
jgi:hypothetical protein